ncbi:preprotein translocase subunit YajC [Streptococcus loxodontisalivarius]|uniref:Preprotein translocase subunit YajC n=1 Tax=Streptococcus loxodontisalivarius TaxID=1349415 RepID=A0ABS2PRQ9_9STRE|nr:preprotein translocase subunit YajC [Streptococcus loxodontisalivarius]MBM7642721.1 preprotein translocase subunit YajC [Streptococcus loxodontisalivarius]
MSSIIILLIFVLGMMWFTQRNQKKQATQRQEQLNSLSKGDEIVTIGGLYALIDEVDVDNQKMVLDVDGVFLTFELSALKRVVAKAADQTSADIIDAEVVEELEEIVEETVESAKEEASDNN